MDPVAYKQWWDLHIRRARGEPLSAEEQALYESGCAELDKEEEKAFENSISNLRELRETILRREAENERVRARCQELKLEIAELEARLDERTRKALGIGG